MAAALAWSALAVLWVAAFLQGWLIVPIVAVLAAAVVVLVALFMSLWRLRRFVMLVSLAVWAACTIVFR